MAKNDEPEKVQDGESWDLGFNVRKYSRWMDDKGRLLIVIDKWRDWDPERRKFTDWKTVSFLNVELEQVEEPMLYDRFVHYVAYGKIKPFIPNPLPFHHE